MDSDLIRLILLLLGVGLVAGIWLWDRWQRSRGELPMVRVREPEPSEEDDDREWEETTPGTDDTDAGAEGERRAEPGLDRGPVFDDDSDGEPTFADPPASPVIRAERSDKIDQEKAKPASSAQASARVGTSWVQPAEPVIPAFLMRADSVSLETRDDVSLPPEHDAEPYRPTAAEPTLKPQPAPKPESRPARESRQPRDDDPSMPSLQMSPDDEPALPVLELAPEPVEAPAKPRSRATKPALAAPESQPVSIRNDEDQFDLDLGFSAVDDQDLQEVAVDLPDLILQINIVARGEPFTGEQIQAAMEQVEMRAGEHDIFHRYDNRATKGKRPKVLFSLASLVEPGHFPLKKMADFSTPGLTLFAQLPGPRDGLLIYSDMLYVAERLVRLLDARLKDENRSTLTKQTIEHTRERIAEHKRQITLKLRQASEQQRGRR